MVISVAAMSLVLNLCGAGNNSSCRSDMTRCFESKKRDEVNYSEAIQKRTGQSKDYPESNLVYECAMDQGLDFDIEEEESPSVPVVADIPAPTPVKNEYHGLVFE